VGDFDANGFDDLVVGAPWFDGGGLADVGGEVVIYGSLFADGFEIGSTGHWSAAAGAGPEVELLP